MKEFRVCFVRELEEWEERRLEGRRGKREGDREKEVAHREYRRFRCFRHHRMKSLQGFWYASLGILW